MNCAFLSIANTDGWFIDDDLVHPHLQSLGWKVDNIPWNKSVDWNMFDLVIIRSPWDYQAHLDAFLDVLQQIDESKAILINSLKIVRWNINKNYLFDLESKGVELVPTIKANSLKKSDVISAFEQFNSSELIVKPIIGANADDTFRIQKNTAIDFELLESVFINRECLIQPFMQNIVDEGEFSLIYFQGELNHTILKTVKTGDYRVQEEHGGGVIPIKMPDPLLVGKANKAISVLDQTPFYARVDLVRTAQNSYALMELELIEPCLYFRFDKNSAKTFAECIHRFYKNNHMQSKGL
jgi:hypothetical protein